MNKLTIKKGDTVVVISGESKGGRGEVLAVSPEEKQLIVKGQNMVSKHLKARKQGENSQILKTEGPIRACKVMLVCKNSKCPKYNQGVRTKVGYKTVGDKKVKIRLCAKCGAEI